MISIVPNFNTPNGSNYCAKAVRQKPLMRDNRNCNVSFTGHSYFAICKNSKFPVLIHETSFFREPDTLEFIKSYIEKKFNKEHNLFVLVGACSTGEEAVSLKMMLPERAKIKGIDLGESAISMANEGKYEIKNPKFMTDDDKRNGIVKYGDSYLAFPTDRNLTEQEKEYKKKFNQIFEEVKSDYISSFPKSERQSISFRLKRDCNKNLKFKEGNILELDTNVPQESTHVITFRNALYHLLSNFTYGSRAPKANITQKSILDNFAKQINKTLKKDGILVLGENETAQGTNWKLVSEALSNNGFKPIWGRNADIKNVWQKVDKN